ncbi:PqqD family peptide modification chaperone [Tardiphaga sp. P9-11]|jgi:hypothetical protein|uniref:PqqD family peptide modification chaperone n=1 Tax=Tardiphaga sp. P9-11 TaxID=2024614 RepID=UPI0011F35F85|nr:PqqD family peptide modification chaperone [Tardiphaga sp. P9-11]KAA0072956.1 PqqD family peptide modification chaperone [Tardiphaga sp. P9-11]
MNFIAPPGSQSPFGVLRPAIGTSFALVDQLPVLFSEDEQKLFELNDVAAFIWCSMLDAMPFETISDQLVDRGLSPARARESVRDALNQWLVAGLIVPHRAADFAFNALVGQTSIEIRASDAQTLHHLRSLFIAMTAPTGCAQTTFRVYQVSNTSIVMHDDRRVLSCAMNELAPTFKAYVIRHLLLAGDARDVIFHAAAVTSGTHGMLISGHPGTGKSTLTMHLLNAGFGYSTDDIVTISPDGSIRGAPFAPTLKANSWSLIDDIWPDVNDVPIHDRPDGHAVRYLDVEPNFHEGAIRIDWIIFLERASDCTLPVLVELRELDTIKRIVDASFAANGKLTSEGFRTLKSVVSHTRSFVLHYSEAADATVKLIELCDGKL